MSDPKPPPRVHLNREAIRALRLIIVSSVAGIILLSFWGLALRAGLFGAATDQAGNTVADEALSILGNIASAAVGGLVGWLTRDYMESPAATPEQIARPAPTVLPIEPAENVDLLPEADPDTTWDDEPGGEIPDMER